MICALISPTFSFIRSRQSFWPWIMASRASLTQSGQSESVCRGHPSVGLVFSQDLRSGLSDHFGVKDGFGLYLLKRSEEHTSELQSQSNLVCRLLLEKKKTIDFDDHDEIHNYVLV